MSGFAAVVDYQANGFDKFSLETWSGNLRMLKCAEKLGFSIVKRAENQYNVNVEKFDALTLSLDLMKFNICR